MKKYSLLILMCAAATIVSGRTFTIRLYDYQPSRSNGITEPEYIDDRGCVFNTTEPTLTVTLPDGGNDFPCVLTIPGGGYKYISMRNEGKLAAERLVKENIAVAVLKYRLPNGHAGVPLADAQRAMEILRDSAALWHIDSNRIGVMGFSAGGHLAGCLLTQFKSPKTRPDFGILVYPVTTLDSAMTHAGTRKQLLGETYPKMFPKRYSPVNRVESNTPPCIIFACQDDKSVPVKNSIIFFEELTRQGVPAELHIYSAGGHGWGFGRNLPDRFNFERTLIHWIQTNH